MYFYSVWIISVKALGFVVRNVGLWLALKSKKCVFPIYDSSAGFADIPVLMFILRLKHVSIDKDIYKKDVHIHVAFVLLLFLFRCSELYEFICYEARK